ncbi:hypothetical protein DTO027B5_7158 [Paecilomyces variotii]|nr:hypothetical protein DTO169C6_7529 [Paecilomyces variotii]KAJ9230522.1 hypothetical protein DTO169E5_8361 [Paecilomyces variotii]KAJ9246586.1 hypothetical protein DTO207G8_8780 [Paecilomyces variotii]KAJ9259743.1 hypothetical protein DTO195F2_4864 [Paecilomyces variotii]KAJ9306575.1 hypothetical protein DTO217A2_3927 [Paecilomyces variotii]
MPSSPANIPPKDPSQGHPERSNSNSPSTSPVTILLSILSVLSAVFIAYLVHSSTTSTTTTASADQDTATVTRFFPFSRLLGRQSVVRQVSNSAALQAKSNLANLRAEESGFKMRTPVYFISHGGPNVMYERDHPAYSKLQELGREITTKVKPRAVVVFSAHWQAGPDTIQVNTAEITDLIYDFYGFPSHYYKEKFPNVGSKEVAQKVIDALHEAGIKAEGVKRGLDHGVWAGFKCAFDPETNPLKVPIVQVSLFGNEDPAKHYKLGQALSKLRDENIQIIGSGMAVHNLRDMHFTFGDPRPLPYTVSFDEALKDAATAPPEKREQAMVDLLKRPDARQAHPFFDHILPVHIAAGAAGEDKGRRLWTLKSGSMSWAQFRFGEPAVNGTL